MDAGDIGLGELAGCAARSPSPFREGDRDGAPGDPALANPGVAASNSAGEKSAESAGARETLASRIAKLKAEQQALNEQKKRTSKDLKNAERKRRRLKLKAKSLSHDDLLQLLQMRADGHAENSSESSTSAKNQEMISEEKRD